MANKKRKKNEDLPEGMSRRQAKMAAREAERAALEKDARPYEGLAAEADLVAMQEFVPAASAKLEVDGIDRDVYLCTVLPGAAAAQVRDEQFGGDAYVALQVKNRSHNPGRDLAYALNWVKGAAPGETLESTIADGNQPKITDLIPADAPLGLEVHQDFAWWLPEGADVPFEVRQMVQSANETITESHKAEADIPGSAWWSNSGGTKAYMRWVRVDEDENALLQALARIAARGELTLGEDTKFAGVFRTHGLIVPVFDLPRDGEPQTYNEALEQVDKAISAELSNDAQLDPEERKQLENIKSRQVTLR